MHLRYEIDGTTQEVDSIGANTGHVSTPRGVVNSIILRRWDTAGSVVNNLVLIGWKNLRQEISEEKSLIPGAVWGGSAAFVLGVRGVEEFARIKDFELVVVDYSGDEWVQKIEKQARWIDEANSFFFDNRVFTIDDTGKITYSK